MNDLILITAVGRVVVYLLLAYLAIVRRAYIVVGLLTCTMLTAILNAYQYSAVAAITASLSLPFFVILVLRYLKR